MVSSRSSIRSWHALALLFFCSSSSVSASAGLRIGAVSNRNSFPGRVLKKDEKKETEASTDPPTLAPTDLAEAPTAFPTDLSSVENSFEKELVEFQLAPFSILVHGSLSTDDVFDIKEELQEYILGVFLEEQEEHVGIKTDSIVLTMVQMVESFIPSDEADDADEADEGGRQRGRDLQLASSSESTVTTMLKYDISLFLRFKEDEEEDVILDLFPAVEEIYVKALMYTKNLQGYFLDVFSSEVVASGGDANPVVLMEVQIDENSPMPLNSEQTWERIESILNPSSTTDVSESKPSSTTDMSENVEDKNGNNFNAPNQSGSLSSSSVTTTTTTSNISSSNSVNGLATWKLAVYIVCAMVVLVGCCGATFVTRKKKKKQLNRKSAFSKGNGSSSEEVVENVIKVTNDANKSEEQNYEKIMGMTESNTVSTGNNISFEGSNNGISIGSQNNGGDGDDPEIQVPSTANGVKSSAEVRSSKNSSFMSFLQKSFKGKPQEQEGDEQTQENDNVTLDSFGLKLNLNNTTPNDDDDSMMGYSLTSLNRSRYNDEVQQDESTLEDPEAMSDASSVSDSAYNDKVFAGVQKILEQERNEKKGNKNKAESVLNSQQDQPRNLLSDITIDRAQGESISKSKSFETEDVEVVSVCKDDGSIHGEVQSVVSAYSINGIAANASKYYGQDEIMMTEKIATPAPSEEFRSVSPILNITTPVPSEEFRGVSSILNVQNVGSNSNSAMNQNTRVVDDVASDAPSDERNSAMPPPRNTDRSEYPDAIRNSRLVDNDPAVLKYLVKEPRRRNGGSTGSVSRQPRLTMEL